MRYTQVGIGRPRLEAEAEKQRRPALEARGATNNKRSLNYIPMRENLAISRPCSSRANLIDLGNISCVSWSAREEDPARDIARSVSIVTTSRTRSPLVPLP